MFDRYDSNQLRARLETKVMLKKKLWSDQQCRELLVNLRDSAQERKRHDRDHLTMNEGNFRSTERILLCRLSRNE